MSEAAMRKSLRPLLRPLHPVRIESPITSGVPDVNYTDGWVELKFAPRWPPRKGPLRIDHFTKEQRSWLVERRVRGGRAFLLLKVGRSEWLLFDGSVAAAVVGEATQPELYEACLARWTRLPKTKEICTCLTQ